jgi:hypothetical protein
MAVRFQVFMAVATSVVFWDVTLCSLLDVYCLFRETCYPHYEDSRTFLTVGIRYQIIQHLTPELSNLRDLSRCTVHSKINGTVPCNYYNK